MALRPELGVVRKVRHIVFSYFASLFPANGAFVDDTSHGSIGTNDPISLPENGKYIVPSRMPYFSMGMVDDKLQHMAICRQYGRVFSFLWHYSTARAATYSQQAIVQYS